MRAEAYAKINLSLEVLGLRPDRYHRVVTVLQTVALADQLHVEPSPQLTVECSQRELSGAANLAMRAAEALQKATGCLQGATIRIDKHIPIAMGLGGGSSDAATTLVLLNSLWSLGLATNELEEVGRGVGTDVPFFVKGGTSLGEGRGDVIKSLRPLEQQWVVLVCPQIAVAGKTGRLYSMLGREAYTDGRVTHTLAQAINQGRWAQELLFNVFEQVAFDVYPGLDLVMEDMTDAGATFVHLSGTGPALYTLLASAEEGRRIWDGLVKKGHKAFLLRTIPTSSHLTLTSESN